MDSTAPVTPATRNFDMEEALKVGWKATKKNILFFAGAFVIFALLVGGSQWLSSSLEENAPMIALMVGIVSYIVQQILTLGLVRSSLLSLDNKPVSVASLFETKGVFTYFLASLLYGLAMLVGFLLLIIPGIIIAIRLQFYSYFIVDKNLGPIAALQASWDATSGNTLRLFVFGILQLLILIIGVLALVIGLLWAYPTILIADAYVYRKLAPQR